MIGGGLAGVSTALRCRDAGFSVTLLEARSRLGGATYSFLRGDREVDTGQHVLLRCYSAYTGLLRRLGVLEGIDFQSRFRVPMMMPGRRPWVVRRGGLPAPAHLLPVLLGHRALTPRQRVRAAFTALALQRLDPDDPMLDRVSFGQWLRARAEPEESVRALWGLLIVAALNAEPDDASLALAVRVFRTGVLDSVRGGDIGVPRRPLGQLHDLPAREALTRDGAEVRLRTKALSVRPAEAGLNVEVDTGRDGPAELEAAAVVVAVPHTAATKLLEPVLPEAGQWSDLSAAPIVNVHVRFDRVVTEEPMTAALDSPVQWIFDRSAAAGVRDGQYLVVSLSAAHSFVTARSRELRDVFLPALGELLPRVRWAEVLDFFVTREPAATFLGAPGTREIRPPARTRVPGLFLAGAWTATGWPDTLEGAVRSGDRAAEAVELCLSVDRRSGVEVTP